MRSRARQWSRAAWGMAALFASLPVAGRLLLGTWGFDGSTGLAFLFLLLGTWLHFVARRDAPALADPAGMLEEARQLAAEGRTRRAIRLLTRTIRLSPWFWQAHECRGRLYLASGDPRSALADFEEALRFAPGELELRALHDRAAAALVSAFVSNREK